MRIIKRKADNVVLFAGPDLELDATGARGYGWRTTQVDTSNAVLLDADVPANLPGACYVHSNGTLTAIPAMQAQIDAHFAATSPSEAEIVASFMAAVQHYMDGVAVSFGYDHLIAVISYAEEPAVPRYQTEGKAFRAWRSRVWAKCETVFAAVKAGTRAVPSAAELLAELPAVPVKG